MRKKKLKAACLVAGLATAWGGADEARATYRINGWAEPDQPLTDAVFIVQYYRLNASGEFHTLHALGDLPGNQRTDFAFNLDDNDPYGEVTDLGRYMLLGIYDDANDGLSISLEPGDADAAINGGNAWGDFFANYPQYSESIVAGWLRDLDELAIGNLESMLGSLSWSQQYFGAEAPLVNFSTAAASGTVFGQGRVVPEPAVLMMIAPGLGLVVMRRRDGDSAAD